MWWLMEFDGSLLTVQKSRWLQIARFDHRTSRRTCSRNFEEGNFLLGRHDGAIENFNSR
jgi:hypothetical protein